MKTLPFIKMHGLGNDYVYLDCFRPEVAELLPALDLCIVAQRMSDRHTGIGSDGLVLIMPSKTADIRMRMFNADGSEAEMCGNAARCIARYAYEQGICGETMTLETLAGTKRLSVHADRGRVTGVTVIMGTVIGNPHEVFFVDTPDELDTAFRRLCTDTCYAGLRETANVECAYVINRSEIRMRVLERGTGETQACGTGACAVATAAMDRGLTDSRVTVHLRGGDLEVSRNAEGVICLTGPATIVYTGEFILEES